MPDSTKERFSSKLGLILSVLGIAIGTGNIWRFPRIAAQNGGDEGAGAFLVAWLCFLLLWSIPLIIAEYGMGRNGRKGVVGSFVALIGKKSGWLGGFVGFVATAIMFYYSVVASWCLYYLITSIGTALPADLSQANAIWEGFQGSNWPLIGHAIVMGVGGFIVIKGISSIERVNKVLIPSLLLVLIISLFKALSLEGSGIGVEYLFTPDWDTLKNPEIWLEALTQNAWDTGAAWGLILTYAAYMRKTDDITISAFQTGIGNNMVSLLAAVIIFSTVFGTLSADMSNAEILNVMQTSGPASTGLTFIWMPQLFATMGGGNIFAILFFLGLTFAAFSSLISMIELAVKVFVDMGANRKRATMVICGAGFGFGIPSALNLTFFANQDFVWGVGLMVSGALISYAVIKYGIGKFRSELINTEERSATLGKWWEIIIKYVVPVEVVTLLGWWMYLSATSYAPDTWYNPLSPFSVMTVIVQWGLALFLVWFFRKRLMGEKK
ncbi:sodium-dependent transporter [Gracilimonas mengyeensis]|uniref:Neurotransmitter:Na+ symporter, NSS family n=1 Tax=Gracilimonas mengyeensis TaxID=1302730 RepID=A0A521ATV1_9BACT|nr:sodium-dependent transporter [Gracilimonas mengyeensis]SMO38205.1 neurotransmitter:Na+ symporter, NSS family [Gracilimonas mengyeensis]